MKEKKEKVSLRKMRPETVILNEWNQGSNVILPGQPPGLTVEDKLTVLLEVGLDIRQGIGMIMVALVNAGLLDPKVIGITSQGEKDGESKGKDDSSPPV